MRVLLLGGNGQLGQDVFGHLENHRVSAPTHDDLDVSNRSRVIEAVASFNPDVVINCSAYADVNACEEQFERAFAVNGIGPRNLACACRETGAVFVNVSTDYVFDGTKSVPYDEDDLTAPLNVYGASKLAGDQLALAEHSNTYIVRTSGIYGTNPCRTKPGGANFVSTILRLASEREELSVVNDQQLCPTYTEDLARQLVHIIETRPEPGVYHAVNTPGVSWFEFARLILSLAQVNTPVVPVSSDKYPSPARRPADSRLKNTKIGALGLNKMRPLHVALEDYLKQVTKT